LGPYGEESAGSPGGRRRWSSNRDWRLRRPRMRPKMEGTLLWDWKKEKRNFLKEIFIGVYRDTRSTLAWEA
jgi:hypothetical protein